MELLCTAGSGPSTILWASALLALCSSLERFVMTHMAFPSWCFTSFHSSSFLLLYYLLFLHSCYFTLPFLGEQMYIMCLPEELLLGQGFLFARNQTACVRLRKKNSSSTVENLMLLESSLHIQHLRMILQIHRKWEDYQWN